MAKFDINLIPRELQKEFHVKEMRTSLNFLGAIVFGATLFLAGALTFYAATLRQGYKELTGLEKREIQKIKDLEVIEREGLRLSRKTKALAAILGERRRYSYLLDVLSDSTLRQVTVTALTTGAGDDVSISGTADGYVTLAKFLLSLLEPDLGGRLFKEAELRSVSLDERTGKARFTIILYVKEGGLTFK